MNCMMKAPATRNGSEGANAHSGMVRTPPTSAEIMARRRPNRSERWPKKSPPTMAPTIEKAVSAARRPGVKPQSRCRKVGYMSCVPCETKFIIVIMTRRYRKRRQ